ncbi:pre-B-cell leukemia transcription factor-interacting protein 1-like [Heptranchias perlo]|uniref:pre-B-cell leukemia transcription factor-interacting protein 1-like n=1 Tax=Heptranchias perlo TaxID=212740 RepID=UPI00355982BB
MSGSPDEAQTSVQTPLERTEESAVETLRDGTDELPEISDPPAEVVDSPSPPEHEERARLESSGVGPQESEIPLEIPLEDGAADRRSSPPEDAAAFSAIAGGSRVGACPGVPAEDSGGESHEQRAGASGPGVFTDLELDPEGEGVPSEVDRINKRVMDGHPYSDLELPPSGKSWIDPYPDNPEGGPSTMIFLSALLDRLANENQQIRAMHVELQVQKDELESFLKAEGEKLPEESQQNLNQLSQQLSKHLQHEETTLLALQGELQDLRQKVTTMEGGSVKPIDLATESEKLSKEAIVNEQHLESFLTQKENLVAEALMLRQELDKQRTITISMRQALESLIEQVSTVEEGMEAPKILEGLEEMERKLALELEHSETWEKVYGKSKEEKRRKKEAKYASKNWGREDRQAFEGRDSSSTKETSCPSSNVTAEESMSDPPLKTMEEAKDNSLSDPPLKTTEEAKDNSLSDPPLNTTQEAGDGSVIEKLEMVTTSVKSTFAQLSDAAKDLFRGDKQEPLKDKKPKEWKDKTHGWKHEKPEERDGSKEGKKTDEWTSKLREGKSRERWATKQHKEWKGDLNVKRDDKDHHHDHQKKPEGHKDHHRDHQKKPEDHRDHQKKPEGHKDHHHDHQKKPEGHKDHQKKPEGHKDHHHDHQKKPEGHKDLEKDQKYKEHKQHKEPEKRWKEPSERKQSKEVKRRHHDHNKFWKKDQELKYQEHRYGAPVSCSDVHSCARKEGMDLFNVALDPVRADEFRLLLKDYVQKSNLGSAWGAELEAMIATFFREGVFIHDQMKFSDFVDDLEDYIEEMAEKLYGDDDAVEDFEDYVFRRLLGEATVKHRNTKKDKHRGMEHHHKSHDGHRSARNRHQHRQKDWEGKWRPIASKAGV